MNNTSSFENFLVLQGYLMGNNIVFMGAMDSILMWNPFGVYGNNYYILIIVGIYY